MEPASAGFILGICFGSIVDIQRPADRWPVIK